MQRKLAHSHCIAKGEPGANKAALFGPRPYKQTKNDNDQIKLKNEEHIYIDIWKRLRSTMGQERLQSLMLMSVESDILTNLNTKLHVKEFADLAPRKMDLV